MRIIPIILILLIMSACSTKQKNDFAEIDWCQHGVDKAHDEIKDTGISITKYISIGGGSDEYDLELKQLLNESGLSFRYEALSCIVFGGEDEERDCYDKTMQQAIESKYGLGFMQKVISEADSLYSIREKNTYKYSDLDNPLTFDGMDEKSIRVDNIGKYINRNLTYPKGFNAQKPAGESPIISIDILIDQTGKIFDLKIYGEWVALEDIKHQHDLEEEIEQLISKIDNWEKGKVKGKSVYYTYKEKISIGS